MKCFNCSAVIDDSARFCTRCGADQGFSPALIQRGIAGDQAALTELYNKTYDNVYYTVKALVRDEDAALDVMQDSYLKAFRSLSTLKEADKFRAWIKRIAHNNAVDHLRKAKPVMFSSLTIEDDDTEVEFEDTNTANLPDVVIDQQETARLMAQILDTLPEEQRLVISMYYYEGMSVKDIAGELGITENTVKSRLNYARKKIEVQVLDLEKKGTKLYGLAPMPFLQLLMRSWTSHAASPASSVLPGVLSNTAHTASSAMGYVPNQASSAMGYAPNQASSAMGYAPNQASSAVGYNANQSASAMGHHMTGTANTASGNMTSGVNTVSKSLSGAARHAGRHAFFKGGIKGAFAAFKASLPAKIVAGVLAVSITAGVAVPNIISGIRKADTEVKDVFKDYLGNPEYICVDLSALPDEIEILDSYDNIEERNPATLPEGYGRSGIIGHSGFVVESLGVNCFVTDSYTWLDLQKYKVDIFFGLCPAGRNEITYYTTKLEVTPDRLGDLIVADGSYTTGTDENGQPTRFYSIHWQDVSGVTPAKNSAAPAVDVPAETEAPTTARWAQLYTDHLNGFDESTIDTAGFSFADLSELDGIEARHYNYTLLYLDEDSIPELLISPVAGTTAIGTIVCWIHNDTLYTQNTYTVMQSDQYENDFYGYGLSAEGHYETHQYTISGDKLTDTKVGEYIPGTHQPNSDQKQDQYYWKGEPVDIDSYTASYNAFVESYPGIPASYEQKDDIISEIQRMGYAY